MKMAMQQTGGASRLRWSVGTALALLIGGAVYLFAVRGEAMLLDLTALSKSFLCF